MSSRRQASLFGEDDLAENLATLARAKKNLVSSFEPKTPRRRKRVTIARGAERALLSELFGDELVDGLAELVASSLATGSVTGPKLVSLARQALSIGIAKIAEQRRDSMICQPDSVVQSRTKKETP